MKEKEISKSKRHSTTPVVMTELVIPPHTNALGNIFGGVVMSWIDIAGAIAAQRFSNSAVVTVSVDYLHFITPIKIGYVVTVTAQVTFVGRTSMEVEVLVDAENVISGDTRRATKAYLTYVAIDEHGRPKPAPKFIPKTADEKKRFKEAEKRRELRLQQAKLNA